MANPWLSSQREYADNHDQVKDRSSSAAAQCMGTAVTVQIQEP